MIEVNENDKIYRLPNGLTNFQTKLYKHLIDWKRKHISEEAGLYKEITYDAILPLSIHKDFPLIYREVLEDLLLHKEKFEFKLHKHFNHIASSQAANINLFLPILLNETANDILKQIKPDFKNLATDYLYKGFRIEYWDGNSNREKGLLGDHSAIAGTDSDIAIAYYNNEKELCLWLIEHKLTEKEFTECGGFKSNGREKSKHLCEKTYEDILENKNLCYYHDVKKTHYWNITESNKTFFENHDKYKSCPFKGGMNQLWRNQLLGLEIEKQGTYNQVYFSVVHHPDNNALNDSINQYKDLINNNPKFSVFTSKTVVVAASNLNNKKIDKWVNWYKELYNI